MNFNNIFYLIKIVSFQHVINVKNYFWVLVLPLGNLVCILY